MKLKMCNDLLQRLALQRTPSQSVATKRASRSRLATEAFCWLSLTRICLWLLPFSSITRRIGTLMSPKVALPLARPSDPLAAHVQLAEDVGWAVSHAVRFVPFKVSCLPQALAAKMMLRRLGVTSLLYLSAVQQTAGSLEAHAWVVAAGVDVIGYPQAYSYIPLVSFL